MSSDVESIYNEVGKEKITLEEFPENPKTFSTSLKLLEDAKQIIICHMGLRFDSYLGICSHMCSYCYARGQNMRYHRWASNQFKIADLTGVKKTFENVFENKKDASKYNLIEECISNKYPIRIGTQTDCFQLAERKYKVSYIFIDEVMNKYHYPYAICTKSNMVCEPEYMKLYEKGNGNVAFQFTLSTLKQNFLDKIERGAPTAQERLNAMRILSQSGYTVVCRMSPYIPEYTDDAEELIKALSENGCKHLISELLRVTPILNRVMIRECDYDVISLYRKLGVKMTGGYYRYPIYKKIEIQNNLKLLCDKYGISFATCADEDPSMHTTKMCCGFENLELFKSCPYATYDTAYKMCKEQGELSFDDFVKSNYCPDKKKLREMWDKGYFCQVLKNFEFDRSSKKYYFVECNNLMTESYKNVE